MMDKDLEEDAFPMVIACSHCEVLHLDCEGFVSYKDKEASLCSEHCSEEYDEEYDEEYEDENNE